MHVVIHLFLLIKICDCFHRIILPIAYLMVIYQTFRNQAQFSHIHELRLSSRYLAQVQHHLS